MTKAKNENQVLKVFKNFFLLIYRFIKYVYYGLIWPIFLVGMLIGKYNISSSEKKLEKMKKISEKEALKEKERKEKEKNKIDTTSYKDESVVFEKKNLGYYINAALTAIISIPKSIKKRFDNIALVKQARNKKDFEMKAMLVDFSGEDEDTKGKRIAWKYVAVNNKGKKITGYFEAYSRLDVQSFLLGEGLNAYSIKTSGFIQKYYNSFSPKTRFKNKDLIFLLAQLST